MELFEYIDFLNEPYDIFYDHSKSVPLHWHYYSEILYVRKGQLRLTCDDCSYDLNPGSICYIYPLQLHEMHKTCSEDIDYAVIKFNIHTLHIPKAFIQQIYDYFMRRSPDNEHCIIIDNADIKNPRLPEIIDSTVDEFNRLDELYAFQILTNIYSILIAIIRLTDKSVSHEKNKYSDEMLSFYHILEYIDTHSGEELEIKDLAKKCNLSYSHFARLFRESYGRSCKDYITYIRLNKADELLMHTDYSISYIANETGFFDSSHFISTYRKWKGITPKQQRKLFTNTDLHE